MAVLEVWVGLCKRRNASTDPQHWIIMVRAPESDIATWYHATGGPTQKRGYKLEIQNNKRFQSFGVAEHHFVGQIDAKHQNKLKASAQSATLQRCQLWTVQVLRDLERKELVAPGTGDYWADRVEYPSNNNASNVSAESTTTSDSKKWVWDKEQGQYRYLDKKTQRWVWQSEVSKR